MKSAFLLCIGLCAFALWSCESGAGGSSTSAARYSTSVNALGTSTTAPAPPPTGIGDTTSDASRYNELIENSFVEAAKEPISTFSIDADGASYANMRRYINVGSKPPTNAIRTEELINYFQYNYAEPTTGGHPLAINGEVSSCPWNSKHNLLRIGFKGRSIPETALPASNIVLLIDVSGSMGSSNKLPLLQDGLMYFVDKLKAQDKVAIVVYAGAAGVPLPATSGADKTTIKNAIRTLASGGSTAGAQGIITAYQIAQQNLVLGGNNRVILMTDGDFNVGPSSQKELVDLIVTKRNLGIFLTVIGVGTDNLNDAMMEQVADKGNGIYEYIDNLEQAKKVFVYEFEKFFTVAKDVKIQVSFDPTRVQSYRLVGYENRLLQKQDFDNDTVDAGDLSAGQTVTALYEIIPSAQTGGSLCSIDFRYKLPNDAISRLLTYSVNNSATPFALASENMRFAGATAAYSLILRNSKYNTDRITYPTIGQWVASARTFDPFGFRQGFLTLIAASK